jgi:hypothetical protein
MNHSSIQKIIVTKKPSHGYLILHNLMHDVVEDSDGSATENLQLWLQNYCRDHDMNEGRTTIYEYDFFAIINSINNSCFDPKFKPQKLLYHQVWFRYNENVTRIFDIKTFKQYKCNDYVLRNDPNFINYRKGLLKIIRFSTNSKTRPVMESLSYYFSFYGLFKNLIISRHHS